jgi:hypothetical protein
VSKEIGDFSGELMSVFLLVFSVQNNIENIPLVEIQQKRKEKA